jgi:DNA-binding NarL/FixJ family response regulator
MFRIILADDHPVVRDGLACLLVRAGGFEIAGVAGSCAATQQLLRARLPDLLVLDLYMHGRGGVTFVENLMGLFAALNLLILAEHEETLQAPACLRAGARGYVMKNRPTATILEAIRVVAEGGRYTSPELNGILLETLPYLNGGGASGLASLSARELDVFHLLGRRQTVAEMAASMALSEKTVQTYFQRLKVKLACRTMRELHRQAQEWLMSVPS